MVISLYGIVIHNRLSIDIKLVMVPYMILVLIAINIKCYVYQKIVIYH